MRLLNYITYLSCTKNKLILFYLLRKYDRNINDERIKIRKQVCLSMVGKYVYNLNINANKSR